MAEQNENQQPIDKEWEEISDIVAERDDVDLPEDDVEESSGGGGHTTLKQRQIESPRLSDMQVFDNRMFPDMGEGNEWLNRIQSSEVFPDSFNNLERIYVKGLLKDKKDMSFHKALADVNTSLSIALNRDGRIDFLSWSGSNLQKEADKDEDR